MQPLRPLAKAKGRRPNDGEGLDDRHLDRLLGYRLVQAYLPTLHIFEEAIGLPLNLTQVDFTILALLDSNEWVTHKSLSLALRIAPPNMTLVVDRLTRRGLVHRVASETDRRARYVCLTMEGAELTKNALRIAASMEKELLSQLTRADCALLFRTLREVARSGKRDGGLAVRGDEVKT